MAKPSPMKTNMTSTYVQLQAGVAPIYIGDCVAMDSFPSPRGDKSLITALDNNGNHAVYGDKRSAPGVLTLTLNNLIFSAKSAIEGLRCPFNLFVTKSCDGKRGVFTNWERAYAAINFEVINDPISPVSQRDAQDEMTHQVEVSGWPPRFDFRNMTLSRITTAEVYNGLTICDAGILRCGQNCGSQQYPCDVLLIGSAPNAGVATANLMRSADGGATWAATAADPFASNTNSIVSVRTYLMNNTTMRYLCVRDTLAATPLQAAYSDDNGATWTTVNLGATVAEAAYGDQSICALDDQHIWVCTTAGRVYKSTDGAATFTEQTTALTASGAAALNAIHFCDENVGFAVGAAGLVIYTQDGGTNWLAATVTGANAMYTVWTFSKNRFICGGAAGSLYMSFDGGTSYTTITGWTGAGAGNVRNIKFTNELAGFMVVDTAAPVGFLFRTIDGGATWSRHTNPDTNVGYNAIHPCPYNESDSNALFGAGNAQGGTQYVLKASG